MYRIVLITLLAALTACALETESSHMFTTADMSNLKFLEGRWEGTGPDGNAFYEQYAFANDNEMTSTRFADSTFAAPQDGSVVTLEDGRVVSTWGEFTWHASELVPGKACFIPVNAPSSFCWERLSDTSVHVIQSWTDEQGNAQQYTVPLRRL